MSHPVDRRLQSHGLDYELREARSEISRHRRLLNRSFSWYRGYPIISIEMTDRDVIDRFAELFRDPSAKRHQQVMRRENKQLRKDGTQRLDSYRYQTNSRPAIRIMFTLYPFLGKRHRLE